MAFCCRHFSILLRRLISSACMERRVTLNSAPEEMPHAHRIPSITSNYSLKSFSSWTFSTSKSCAPTHTSVNVSLSCDSISILIFYHRFVLMRVCLKVSPSFFFGFFCFKISLKLNHEWLRVCCAIKKILLQGSSRGNFRPSFVTRFHTRSNISHRLAQFTRFALKISLSAH